MEVSAISEYARAAAAAASLALAVLVWVQPAFAQDHSPPLDTASANWEGGTGASYWGEVPTFDSTIAEIPKNRPIPLWEGMLVWPYRVVTYPLDLLSIGVGESIEYLDESHTVQRIAKLFGPRRGPFGVLMQFQAGGLSGLGGGFSLEHDAFFSPSNKFRLSGSTTDNGTHRARLGLRFLSASDGEVDVGAGYRLRPNARYFGLGPETEESFESYYEQELAWLGVSYRRGIGANLYLHGDALASSIAAAGPRGDDYLPITDRFRDALPTGFGSTSQGLTFGASVTHLTVTETGRPTHGGSRRLRATYFTGIGADSSSFWSYRVDLQQFLQLWYPYHGLALRTHMSWIDPVGSVPIPYQRLMTNDDPDLIRGYRDFRWRDRGMVVLSAEYRWPLWVVNHPDALGLDIYLHTDVGQVFSESDQIKLDNLAASWGLGLRLLSAGGFVLRAEFARSNEETVWRVRGDQMFQFARGGFFHGRDPVPSR